MGHFAGVGRRTCELVKIVFVGVQRFFWLGWETNLRISQNRYRRCPAVFLAGVAGFEPTNAGIKIPCLTAWRHPIALKKYGAGDKFRTCYLQSHNLALYRLSYARHILGAPGETRTPDTRLRRPLLYPAELRAHKHICCAQKLRHFGAGDGNRTHATSLEG